MELQVQEFNLCRSISICLFSLYKFASFMILNLKVKEGATADWILELEVPFSGRAISFISLIFVINSNVHITLTWKRSILPNFWVLVKIFNIKGIPAVLYYSISVYVSAAHIAQVSYRVHWKWRCIMVDRRSFSAALSSVQGHPVPGQGVLARTTDSIFM